MFVVVVVVVVVVVLVLVVIIVVMDVVLVLVLVLLSELLFPGALPLAYAGVGGYTGNYLMGKTMVSD